MEGTQKRSEAWTPKQQTREVIRRMRIMEEHSGLKLKEMCFFNADSDDVIIAVPPRNGITWLMHICHQIRVKGEEPDFKHQLEVFYFLQVSEKFLGVKPEAYQPQAKPRMYATHLPYYSLLPDGEK